jgi:hypothetical protein
MNEDRDQRSGKFLPGHAVPPVKPGKRRGPRKKSEKRFDDPAFASEIFERRFGTIDGFISALEKHFEKLPDDRKHDAQLRFMEGLSRRLPKTLKLESGPTSQILIFGAQYHECPGCKSALTHAAVNYVVSGEGFACPVCQETIPPGRTPTMEIDSSLVYRREDIAPRVPVSPRFLPPPIETRPEFFVPERCEGLERPREPEPEPERSEAELYQELYEERELDAINRQLKGLKPLSELGTIYSIPGVKGS